LPTRALAKGIIGNGDGAAGYGRRAADEPLLRITARFDLLEHTAVRVSRGRELVLGEPEFDALEESLRADRSPGGGVPGRRS